MTEPLAPTEKLTPEQMKEEEKHTIKRFQKLATDKRVSTTSTFNTISVMYPIVYLGGYASCAKDYETMGTNVMLCKYVTGTKGSTESERTKNATNDFVTMQNSYAESDKKKYSLSLPQMSSIENNYRDSKRNGIFTVGALQELIDNPEYIDEKHTDKILKLNGCGNEVQEKLGISNGVIIRGVMVELHNSVMNKGVNQKNEAYSDTLINRAEVYKLDTEDLKKNPDKIIPLITDVSKKGELEKHKVKLYHGTLLPEGSLAFMEIRTYRVKDDELRFRARPKIYIVGKLNVKTNYDTKPVPSLTESDEAECNIFDKTKANDAK